MATLVGIGTTAGSLGGIGFPILIGMLLDRSPQAGYSLLFGFCAVAYFIGFAFNHYLAPSFEPVRMDD